MAKPVMIATAGDKVPYANGGLKLSKTILLDKINLHPDFQKLFDIEPELLERITQSIKENGYDNSQPLHLWVHDGEYDLIDGYTRYAALKAADKDTAPYYEHNFGTFDEAYKYVLSLQVNRRNLSGAELLRHVAFLSGNIANDVSGRKSEAIAETLGVSARTVQRAMAVEKQADDKMKEKIDSGEMSVNQAYNELKGRNKAKKEKEEVAEADLNDLPFSRDELGSESNTENGKYDSDHEEGFGDSTEEYSEEESCEADNGETDGGELDAFDMFDDDDLDSETEINLVSESEGIDLAALMSECMEIAERYGLEAEEDVCSYANGDKSKIISACIKFFLPEVKETKHNTKSTGK